MVAPRDVILIWDRMTRPNKQKLHICICPQAQLFLRINSLARFPPTHLLRASRNAFLHHDSHIELTQIVRHIAYEISRAALLGSLSDQEAQALVRAAEAAPTLSAEHKRLIRERLS